MYVTSPIKTANSDIIFPLDTFEEIESSKGQELTFSEGENLFFAGDDAQYVYEVIEGVLKASKVLMDGRRQVLNFCYPGEMIGLSHDSFYHCDCDAVSKVRVRLHKKNAFMKGVEKDPEYCARLLRLATAEVNNMQEHFLMLGRKTAMEKLASFLLAVMHRQRRNKNNDLLLDLPMKRSDIADFLGITIETVSRNLTKLRKLNVIDLPTTHKVSITKFGLLRELAENTN